MMNDSGDGSHRHQSVCIILKKNVGLIQQYYHMSRRNGIHCLSGFINFLTWFNIDNSRGVNEGLL